IVVGIVRGIFARELPQACQDARRTAGRVLVQMQPQPDARRHDTFVLIAHRAALARERTNRTRIEAACAFNPSASASVIPASATARNPRGVICWIVVTRTKSAAVRPPRPAAAPVVGSTWF